VPNGVSVESVAVVSGSCEPDPLPPPVVPTPSFTNLQTLCTPTIFPADCGSGQVCFQNPPNGAIPRYCVASETDDPCPIDYPHERDTIFTGVNDTRGCTDCDCDLAGLTCNVSLTHHPDPGCPTGTGDTLVPIADQCYGFVNWKSTLVEASVPRDTHCNPVGGVPNGELSPSQPTKICCTLP
jgi:hypothetical protein